MGIFGRKEPAPYQAPAAPAPARDISAIQHNIEARAGGIEAKIRRAEAELAGYKQEMARHRVGSSQHSMYKQRAMRVLKQKKMYENQLRGTQNTQGTFDQITYAKETVKDVKETMGYMKETTKAMKKEMGKVNVDDLADLQDEMEDILQDTSEMTEMLGRTYDVGAMDETELEAELEGIGEELDFGATAAPSYLQPQAQTALHAPPQGDAELKSLENALNNP
mmetsp:Transcript_30984/g.75782  ORF Transcript_30984/g.75782 Transcript_30984/m.75782 type:complete len:222 (-) Transcript_30984:478-1143(-)